MAKVKLSACLAACAALAIAAAGCGGDDDKINNAINNAMGSTLVAGATGATGAGTGKNGSGSTGANSGDGKSKQTEAEKRGLPKKVMRVPKTNTKKYKPVVDVKIGMTAEEVRDVSVPVSIRREDKPPGAPERWFFRDLKGNITMLTFKKGKVIAIETFPRKGKQK